MDFVNYQRLDLGGPTYMNNRTGEAKVNRAFTVLDLENQCGGAELVATFAQEVKRQFKSFALPVPGQTVVAVGNLAMAMYPQLAFDFAGARVMSRGGINGADICLCEILAEDANAKRSRYVVIGSGDRMFAEPASKLKQNGSEILVIGRRGTIAHELLVVANQVIYLNDKAFVKETLHITSPV